MRPPVENCGSTGSQLPVSPLMQCRDLLKIDQATYESIVRDLRSSGGRTSQSRRRSQRFPYILASPLVILLHYDASDRREAYQVRPYDISSRGIGVLHGQFVYKSTPALVLMKNLAGQVDRVRGKVVHSRMVKGRIHAIGIEVDDRLDVSRFLASALQNNDEKSAESLGTWIDLVRISPKEMEQILREIDIRAARCDRAKRRVEERHSYRGNAILVVFHPERAGSRATYRVMPTDLSSRGVGFLHGVFVHPGTQCQLILSDLHGQSRVVRGVVARCELAKGRVHTVGVKFEHPIALGEFREADDHRKSA